MFGSAWLRARLGAPNRGDKLLGRHHFPNEIVSAGCESGIAEALVIVEGQNNNTYLRYGVAQGAHHLAHLEIMDLWVHNHDIRLGRDDGRKTARRGVASTNNCKIGFGI